MRRRFVKGTITKTTGGNYKMYSNGNIVTNAGGFIRETADGEIIYGNNPLDAPIPKSVENKKCFCDRDFTQSELTDIIKQLRLMDDIHEEQQYNGKDPLYINDKGELLVKRGKDGFYDLKGKFVQKEDCKKYKKTLNKFDSIGVSIFQSSRSEKIQSQDSNISTFLKELNKTLKNYDINTCIRKIHFLAQCYVA